MHKGMLQRDEKLTPESNRKLSIKSMNGTQSARTFKNSKHFEDG